MLFGVELVDVALDLGLHRADGYPENALSPSEYIDYFLFGVCRVDRLPVTEQGDIGKRAVRLHLLAEDLDSLANLLETHPCIEQPLDHFELDHVRERIETLRTRPGCPLQ
jgi:hypothetical protein